MGEQNWSSANGRSVELDDNGNLLVQNDNQPAKRTEMQNQRFA